MKKTIDIIPDFIVYTDGSCNNFSLFGEGGASYVILDGNATNVITTWSQCLLNTTNNRAELLGILRALFSLPDNSTVLVRTDSQYCIKVLDKEKQTLPHANKDMVQYCLNAINRHKKVYFEWVKGHNGEPYNEMADELAESRMEEVREKFKIPVYTYKDFKRKLTDEEQARLNRFSYWLENSANSIPYRDCIPF